jgi:hypothetical protein
MSKEIKAGNQKAIDALAKANLKNHGDVDPELALNLSEAVQLGRKMDQETAREAKKNGLVVSGLRTLILVDADANITGITVEQPINKAIRSHR